MGLPFEKIEKFELSAMEGRARSGAPRRAAVHGFLDLQALDDDRLAALLEETLFSDGEGGGEDFDSESDDENSSQDESEEEEDVYDHDDGSLTAPLATGHLAEETPAAVAARTLAEESMDVAIDDEDRQRSPLSPSLQEGWEEEVEADEEEAAPPIHLASGEQSADRVECVFESVHVLSSKVTLI